MEDACRHQVPHFINVWAAIGPSHASACSSLTCQLIFSCASSLPVAKQAYQGLRNARRRSSDDLVSYDAQIACSPLWNKRSRMRFTVRLPSDRTCHFVLCHSICRAVYMYPDPRGQYFHAGSHSDWQRPVECWVLYHGFLRDCSLWENGENQCTPSLTLLSVFVRQFGSLRPRQ